jgi:hypothetical protein
MRKKIRKATTQPTIASSDHPGRITKTLIILPRRRKIRRGRKPKPSPYYPRYVLTAAQLKALGRVAVESSQLEGYLSTAVPVIAGIPAAAAESFVARVGVTRLLEMLQKLASATLRPSQVDICKTLISRLKAAIEERNTVTHGAWLAEPENEEDFGRPFVPKRATAHNKQRRMSAANIIKVAKTLEELQYELWEFVIAAWPDRVFYTQMTPKEGQALWANLAGTPEVR